MKFFLSLFLVFFVSQSTFAEALKGPTKLILNSLTLRYSDLKNWKAKFTQEISNPALGTNSFNEGEFVFQSPSKFRFSIFGAEASDFVSNGKEAWHLIFRKGRSSPAFVKHFTSTAQLDLDRYLILLRGFQIKNKNDEVAFLKKFDVEGSQEGDILKLKLVPKKSSEISQIVLLTKNADKIPFEMNLIDALGVTTKIRIILWEKMKDVAPKEFVPKIPKGSEVESYN